MTLELLVRRHWYYEECTIGVLLAPKDLIDTTELDQLCYMLEDKMREVPGQLVAQWKVQNKTAIPCGRFKLEVDYSTRFRKYMFHLLAVPGFSGIRWHSGNTDVDTDGCQLTGESKGDRCVLNSRAALTRVWSELTVADGWDDSNNCARFRMKRETWVTVENGQHLEENDNAARAATATG